MEQLFSKLDELYDEIVEIRRHLHQNPELSFQEVETPKYVAAYHQALGHEVRTEVGGRGVVAVLKGGKPGKTVGLRADFDALPIQEENEVPYKSKVPGVMHACGHDGHTATLLGLAKALNSIKDDLEGTIVFIHQHAEEVSPGGAIAMIEDGCLDGVDVIYGTHLSSGVPVGTIVYGVGPVMAAADSFEITIQGRGGHGASPHQTKDAIVTASQLVMNLQQIVSRRVNPLSPAVVSVGSFVAENAFNVIADKAVLRGTVRTFNEEVRDFIEKEIETIVKGTCQTSESTYNYKYSRGYPALVNHKEDTEFVAEVAKGVPGVEQVVVGEPQMGGEDYAYYLQHVKGTFFFTGAEIPDREFTYPHHHPKFDIDERALVIAAKTLGAATLTFLEQNSNVKGEATTV
ncbi:peptidase M20 [Heyndrickxia shackletonii]|uniref:Peptidase M20 n=1 Tax=Heyndrickxia shackletonii TaxID=157838 RepID=A0A0Q3TK09_9BACI|nr:M20 family metallopeptidase [Heyndrickxia shackletonii]KQL54328.1 peptidase M20 [Heyndrickxia shackletonii]NEZ01449.1 amidohydrolase [Heyndrickxia shackletonii]